MRFLKLILSFLIFLEYAQGSEVQKPLSIIFLDIDGVLMDWGPYHQLRSRIGQKAFELYGRTNYTDLQWKTAGSYCFSESAVENLVQLIELVNKETEVAIVLTSSWRLECSVEEIKHPMFASRSFSKFIIDKTADDDQFRKKRGEEELSPVAMMKYGFSLQNRGAQIEYWLRENQLKYNIKSFVIIDDVDDGISSRFAKNFVQIREFLSPSETQKAYEILIRRTDHTIRSID